MDNSAEYTAASEFWLGPLTNWTFTGESPENMMVITQIIHSIENMLHSLSPKKKINVRLATDKVGASEWSNQKIILPSDYLWQQNDQPSFAQIVDLWTAIALHETGHIVLSTDLEKNRDASHEFIVNHIVEDYWIEHWIASKYPGFKVYLASMKKQFYHEPFDLGDDIVSRKINDLIYTMNAQHYKSSFKESGQALALIKSNFTKAMKNGQVEVWNRIELGREIFQLLFPSGIPYEIEQVEQLKHLNLANPGEIEASAPSKQNERITEVPSPFLLSGKVKTQQMLSFHQNYKSDQRMSWAAGQMVDSWLQDEDGFKKSAKQNTKNKTVIKQPKLNDEAIHRYYAAYKRVKPYIIKLRRKFEKANTPTLDERLDLQQGSLNEEAIYRASFSRGLFKIEEERWESIKQLDLVILVDQSQSTALHYDENHRRSELKRFEIAMDLSVLFAEALKYIKPIDLLIYGYSTAKHSHLLQLEHLYSADLNKTQRLGLIEPKHATPEFAAVKEITLKLATEGRNHAQKLLVVLSDGHPDDYQYGGGEEHKQQIQDWIKKWSKKGFSYAHISLAADTDGGNLYPNSIQFEQDYPKLIANVYRWLAKNIIR